MKQIILITLLIFLSIRVCFSQSKQDFEYLKQDILKDTSQKIKFGNYKNEFDLGLKLLFVGYKTFISSQDASSCTFYPSCSVYAIEAMNKKGVVIGLIDFFDRFSRCNNFSSNRYQKHEHTNLLYDPVY